MANPIDFYDYWGKKRKNNNFLYDREKIALGLMSRIIRKNSRFLDAGCGNGRFMGFVFSKFRELSIKVKGIDYSKSEVAQARKSGLDASQGNLEEGIKEKNESFDVVYAGEVIEHLYNPDKFLEEARRIVRKGGFLLLTTPNLCAWFNRILMPIGIQPLFLEPSTKSKMVGAGFLKKFKQDENPVGHLRIFTFAALKDMLEMNGFKIAKVKGSIFDTGLPKSALAIDKLFKIYPKLSSNLVILARKC